MRSSCAARSTRSARYPDFMHIGDYKTAANQLTEKGFTPAHREMTESLNRDMYEQLVRGIAEGAEEERAGRARAASIRGRSRRKKRCDVGLVDDLAYEDQLDDRVPELQRAASMRPHRGRGLPARHARVGRLPSALRASPCSTRSARSSRARAASIRSTAPSSAPTRSSSRSVACARRRQSIKAIVLRVDSPGGSSVASDVIWRELMITREADNRRGRSSCRCRTSPRRAATTSRMAGARDRRAAGHADRVDRHLRRQDRRSAARWTRSASPTETVDVGRQRRHLLAVHAVHAGAARRRCRRSCTSFYDELRREGRRSRATRRPRR